MIARMARSIRAAEFLAVSIVILPLATRVAEACSCYENPPCSAVWRADAVFVGTVVERVREPVGGTISWTVHHVAVNQRLHGSVDPFIALTGAARPTAEQIEASKSAASPTDIMSTCDYNFEVGRRYVIYATKTAEGRWTTSMCAGTKPIEDATADLGYISGIPGTAPIGRLYGSIERIISHDSAEQGMPAAGVRVELIGPTDRLIAITDGQGKFDVRVPPGDYTIAPVVPPTIRVYGAPFQTSVAARGCAPVQFGIISNGRVEGRMLRQDGLPVIRAQVDIIPADLASDQRPERRDVVRHDR